jgi:dTDP-4-dehydrorhamnose reductase
VANVAVLGSSGMLGSTMTKSLDGKFTNVVEFNRQGISVSNSNQSEVFDVLKDKNLSKVFKNYKFDYIVNCIGVVNKLINDKDQGSIDYANKINAEFPSDLNSYSMKFGIPVITIGTDCVYSGNRGRYSEVDLFDPNDHYGVSKSIGEDASTDAMVIRCSIIGREKRPSNSLIEWVLSHPKNALVKGYVNHIWNGVPTLHFSQVVLGIIKNNNFKSGRIHLVPKNSVSKYELLMIIAREFGRDDLRIEKFEAEISVNRSLITVDLERNLRLWQDGGYTDIPTIKEMISTYARRLSKLV